MEFEERNKKAEASGGPHLLVGYDKLLYMSRLQGVPLQGVPLQGVPLQGVPLQGVPSDDEYGSQDLDVKFTHLKTEHITRLKREVIEILSSCEGKCLKLSQFKSKYNRRFKKKFNESYMLSGGRKEYWNLMAELDIIEFDQNGSRPRIKLKEPHTSQFMLEMGFEKVEKPSSSEEKDPEGVKNKKGLMSRNIGIDMDSGYFSEKLTTLKKDIVNLLKSCEGNCFYLSELSDKYWQTFRRKFHRTFKVLFQGKGLAQFLSELDVIKLEHTGEKGVKKFLIKLKEPHVNLSMQRTSLNTAEELYSSSNFGYQLDEFDSKVPTKSRRPATLADDLAVAAGPIIARVPTVPLAPSDQRVLDSGVQFPAPATTFHASPPLVWSPSLMQDPSHAANIPEGM